MCLFFCIYIFSNLSFWDLFEALFCVRHYHFIVWLLIWSDRFVSSLVQTFSNILTRVTLFVFIACEMFVSSVDWLFKCHVIVNTGKHHQCPPSGDTLAQQYNKSKCLTHQFEILFSRRKKNGVCMRTFFIAVHKQTHTHTQTTIYRLPLLTLRDRKSAAKWQCFQCNFM